MWLSKKMKPVVPTADADLGTTTIAGGSVGVLTRGEVRSLPVYGPGGYVWLPDSGAAVLVIKGDPAAKNSALRGFDRSRHQSIWSREKSICMGLMIPVSICARAARWRYGEACPSREC